MHVHGIGGEVRARLNELSDSIYAQLPGEYQDHLQPLSTGKKP